MNSAELAAALGARVTRSTPVSGGDINDAFRVELDDGRTVFVKAQDREVPGLFAAEAAGLEWLRAGAASLRLPKVLAHGEHWLALEWLELAGRPDPKRFGRGLAELHRSGAPSFGLDQPNYLATLEQDNTTETDWPTFYVERRLRPLCRRAKLGLDRELDQLRARDVFGPPAPPARLHGDLWWGNVAACGGLPDALVRAYEEVTPLAAGWRERIALYQLYPLAAHACLFGGGYGPQVARALATYLRCSRCSDRATTRSACHRRRRSSCT